MVRPLPYERWIVQVPSVTSSMAETALWSLGVSTRLFADGTLTALIRHGRTGLGDRIAICQVELRFSPNRNELVHWLNMCYSLPPSGRESSYLR